MSARAHRTYRTYKSLDDDQQPGLFDDARGGLDAAFAVLWESQLAWLMPWLERHLPQSLQSKLDPDDLVQDVWLLARQGFAQFEGHSSAQYRGPSRRRRCPAR